MFKNARFVQAAAFADRLTLEEFPICACGRVPRPVRNERGQSEPGEEWEPERTDDIL
jgi:hypothetical protein